jgi:hypothetical protein
MTRVEYLLHDLIDSLVERTFRRSPVIVLVVDELHVDLPVETGFDRVGALLMTMPRGRLATGFEMPLGRLTIHCVEPR